MNLVEIVLREGFIYGLMAIGVYITYKVLDFPDLTVDCLLYTSPRPRE